MWKLFIVLVVIATASATPTIRAGRIIGGSNTRIEDHPFQVGVFYSGDYNCGGSIYNPTTIISAAHCTFGQNHALYSVLAGETDITAGTRIPVSQVIEHPQYDAYIHFNDIVILRLASSLVYSDRIQPVNLPPPNFVVPGNQLASFTGWGTMEYGAAEFPNILQVVTKPTLTNAACQAIYRDDQVFTSNLCAGVEGRGACQGDDGSPLIYSGFQVGIYSWGYGCAYDWPAIFTRVSEFLSFIITNSN